MKISEIGKLMPGLNIVKDCEIDALGMATSTFQNKRVLSFLADLKYLPDILANKDIAGIICSNETYKNIEVPEEFGVILAMNPKETFFEIHNMLAEEEFYWKHFENEISKTSKISTSAVLGNHSIKIGENVLIEPNVVIFPGSIIGNDVIIRSGTQIGTSGFQFINDGTEVIDVKTAGRVIIADNVEIQHNCCIDRGVLGGDTILENYVKLDNFVHIAHDDHIGQRTFITAGVKFAGRVTVGKDCWIGVNATFANGINIGDNTKISLGSVVTRDVPANSTVSGNFAIDHKRFIEFIKSIR